MKTILRATLDDSAKILELQKQAYQSEAQIYNDFNLPPLLQTLDELRNDFTQKIFLKAKNEDEIVGSVRAYQVEHTCYIERLIVHPEHQGQGIGTALMQQIELFFVQIERFELLTGHKSEKNIRLYERLGYAIFKKERISESLSFVFMEKSRHGAK